MGVTRSFDAAFLNYVLNHDSVREGSEVEGVCDASYLLADNNNYFLANEHGGFLFLMQAPGAYEVHTQFLPSGRGPRAVRYATEAMKVMFTKTDCKILMSMVRNTNKQARRLAAHFMRACDESDTHIHYRLTKDEWEKSWR